MNCHAEHGVIFPEFFYFFHISCPFIRDYWRECCLDQRQDSPSDRPHPFAPTDFKHQPAEVSPGRIKASLLRLHPYHVSGDENGDSEPLGHSGGQALACTWHSH